MATTTTPIVMILSLLSVTLCNVEVGDKNVLWGSLTPLQLAAMEGRADEVETILQEKKESVNRITGMSPLHWSALRGHAPVIRVLLRFDADIRAVDDDKNTALHMAAVSGSTDAVQELVRARVDINAQNRDNNTALHLAVRKQDFEVVKMLLRFGALTNITDQEGRSPLDLAIEKDNLMIMSLLHSSGAKKIKYATESYGKTTTTPSTTMATTTTQAPKVQLPKGTRRPELRKLTKLEMRLHEAVAKSMDTTIADLCAEGVDPNVADIQNNGYTALHLAANVSERVVLIALARCSANLNVKDFDGNTPLHITVITNDHWATDVLLLLGANPNITNNEGKSPQDLVKTDMDKEVYRGFHYTFQPEHMKWVSDIRPLSESEKTLLSDVQNGYYLDVAESCKDGVDVHVKDMNHKQYTMLHYAVSIEVNIVGTIQMLIRCGANVNARDVNGDTPLHLAVMGKYDEAQSMLLLNGANPYIANKDGRMVYQTLKESSPKKIDNRLGWYMNSMPV